MGNSIPSSNIGSPSYEWDVPANRSATLLPGCCPAACCSANDIWNGYRSNSLPRMLTVEGMHHLVASLPKGVTAKDIEFSAEILWCLTAVGGMLRAT